MVCHARNRFFNIEVAMEKKTALILLAGGIGTRMNSAIPKQFLTLKGKPAALHSLEIFLQFPEIVEVVIVCSPKYREVFKDYTDARISFALPGVRRQDSVFSGLTAVRSDPDLICVHDSARPLINHALVQRVIDEGARYGAATAGMPVKFTVKESDESNFVNATLDRTKLWEIQTPQVIKSSLLKEAFEIINAQNITITDDVSAVEWLKHPVKLVEGDYSNIKITTQNDLIIAEQTLEANEKTKL